MPTFLLAAIFLAGACWYALAGRTPEPSYRAMRRLYARTDGRFNDACLRLLRRLRPAPPPAPVSGFLGDWSVEDLRRVAAELDERGLAMLGRKLPDPMCDALVAFARSTEARPLGQATRERYVSDAARALRYDFDERDILRQPDACRIALDGTFAAIAAAYFGCRPVYDFTTMWWTTRHGPREYSKAAQEFHYDMDRLFFLKFFVYLTDVTPQTGPHVFVESSHWRKPQPLRRDGRYTDAEIEAHYPRERIRHVSAGRGTVFAADTRAFHKGLPVVDGERLVLQVEFAVSRFGQNYPQPRIRWAELQQRGFGRRPDPRTFGNVIA
jgi:hypothetical protein